MQIYHFEVQLFLGWFYDFPEQNELLARDERYEKYIDPYIGGDELNHSPELTHHRYVINLDDLDLEEAHKLPDLLKIVQDEVKPSRDKIKR